MKKRETDCTFVTDFPRNFYSVVVGESSSWDWLSTVLFPGVVHPLPKGRFVLFPARSENPGGLLTPSPV